MILAAVTCQRSETQQPAQISWRGSSTETLGPYPHLLVAAFVTLSQVEKQKHNEHRYVHAWKEIPKDKYRSLRMNTTKRLGLHQNIADAGLDFDSPGNSRKLHSVPNLSANVRRWVTTCTSSAAKCCFESRRGFMPRDSEKERGTLIASPHCRGTQSTIEAH